MTAFVTRLRQLPGAPVLATGMTELALVRHDQERSQVMQRLAFVELPQNPPPLLLMGIPPHDMQGSHQPSILLEDPVRAFCRG